MFEKIDLFQMARAMASHAALRQDAISQNIANADTPGYRARDVEDFAEIYDGEVASPMKSTRAGHLDAPDHLTTSVEERLVQNTASPNGNTVSLEEEMVEAVDVKRQHDLALAIYKSSLNVMRASLGRG